jgi:hypothetical protein
VGAPRTPAAPLPPLPPLIVADRESLVLLPQVSYIAIYGAPQIRDTGVNKGKAGGGPFAGSQKSYIEPTARTEAPAGGLLGRYIETTRPLGPYIHKT